MSEGKRPGGLTALAVLNFVFTFITLLSVLGLAVFFAFIDKIPAEEMDQEVRRQIEALQNVGPALFIAIFVLSAVSCLLLLLSGIGYIKQKKVLGRGLGNVYGILAIVSSVVSGIMFDPEIGGGFNIGTLINLIYPLLTLILINTTFKDDLVN